MTLILNGTDNSATTPAVTGTDTDTGVYYPAANQVAIATSGTQAMLANASQGVQFANAIGVGATTPTTSGAGITFPATQSASSDANTLDDYEEGTWTPGVAYGGGTTGQVYDSQTGSYVKIGRLVIASGLFSISNNGSSTGIATLTGLPFPISGVYGAGTIMGDGFTGTFASLGLVIGSGVCYFAAQLGGTGTQGGWANTDKTYFQAGGKYITLSYFV